MGLLYKGCLIFKTYNTYYWNRNPYSSLEDAKDAVDNAFKILGRSIAKL